MKTNYARIGAVFLTLVMLVSLSPNTGNAAVISVLVDRTLVPNTTAEMRDGQLMVSVRPFVEAMGGTVDWLQADQRVTVRSGGSQVAFWLGSSVVYINGSRLTSAVVPYLKLGRTMVPGWWLAVRLGADVQYVDGALSVVTGRSAGGSSVRPVPNVGHPMLNPGFVFPFPRGAKYEPYPDTWGDPRGYQGQGFAHEGNDIIAAKGTPVVSVAAGKIVRFGWNTLGGYRVTVQLDDQPMYRFYYAHLDRYAPGIYLGARVATGQRLGYVGSTGEGPERTDGKFVAHLHFGIYSLEGAINPYRFLKYWEQNKAAQ